MEELDRRSAERKPPSDELAAYRRGLDNDGGADLYPLILGVCFSPDPTPADLGYAAHSLMEHLGDDYVLSHAERLAWLRGLLAGIVKRGGPAPAELPLPYEARPALVRRLAEIIATDVAAAPVAKPSRKSKAKRPSRRSLLKETVASGVEIQKIEFEEGKTVVVTGKPTESPVTEFDKWKAKNARSA